MKGPIRGNRSYESGVFATLWRDQLLAEHLLGKVLRTLHIIVRGRAGKEDRTKVKGDGIVFSSALGEKEHPKRVSKKGDTCPPIPGGEKKNSTCGKLHGAGRGGEGGGSISLTGTPSGCTS